MNAKKNSSRLSIIGISLILGALVALVIANGVAWADGPYPRRSVGPFDGMMGGWGPGGMMGGSGWGPLSQPFVGDATPISLDQATEAIQDYLAARGDSDLQPTEVMEFERNFYAEVEERGTGVHAFELIVNKYTGAVSPEMGPNMMWNTKYGMMAGMMGGMMGGYYRQGRPTADMPVDPERAKAPAQRYLDRYLTGTTTEEPDVFYGYYTLHTLEGGEVTGMLSVNGYSGSVWYHSWHGPFVQMKDLE
ncbi:MAG: hypothetical protein HY675_03285 [Chloroflexi bacterium]|nr:hypothetical protein [Chloroflexota bacterium]